MNKLHHAQFMPNRPLSIWTKSEISLINYQNYLNRKADRFELTIVDLLYISNFKGGNATVNEKEIELNSKLKSYSAIFIQINNAFKNQKLAQLTDSEFDNLIERIKAILQLSHIKDTAIDGFKSSYLSALLHSYFPNLIPILDRRLLINLNLVKSTDLQKSKQIKKIEMFYPLLIITMRNLCKSKDQNIRQIDKEYFIKQLPLWAK